MELVVAIVFFLTRTIEKLPSGGNMMFLVSLCQGCNIILKSAKLYSAITEPAKKLLMWTSRYFGCAITNMSGVRCGRHF